MRSITFRVDPATNQALTELMASGVDQSDAIRQAIQAAAGELRRDHQRDVLGRLAADPYYRAELEAVQRDLESFRAW